MKAETMDAPKSSVVTVEFGVPAQMRDGTTLRANVYRPEGEGPWPTLLTRTPYGKDSPLTSATLDPVLAARAGFMVVVQDTRGRFASDGTWEPFRHEREDGYDTVEWAAQLRGSNGRVGMYGGSYTGNTQWMAAVEQPPSLGAIAPLLTWSDPLDGLFARGGALELGLTLPWDLQTGADHIAKLAIPDDERRRRLTALLDDYDRLARDGYYDLPVQDSALLRRHGMPDIGTLAMQGDPAVPDWCRVAGRHERVTVPSFHIGGWYDIFVQGTLDNYAAMAALGRPARLVVGPWSHGDERLSDRIGELSFGVRSSGVGAPMHEDGDINDLQLAWFDHELRSASEDDGASSDAPVRIFVMGRNEWRDETSWPLERAHEERWFLGGGGALRPEPSGSEEEPTRFVYDPADPAPTLGGQTVLAVDFPPGPFDQAPVETRADVCVFTSEPLPADLEVTGRVRAVLHVESSVPSTDWVVRLCDVHPDGRSFNLCEGIVRIGEGADACRSREIDMWSTSNVFLAGHRLRVQVTSSSFPRWDRNLNTGDQRDPRHVAAHQRIHHDAQRPSWIELPIVD